MSESVAAAVPIVRCFAGEQGCGLVAAAVERMQESESSCPHLSDLLGIPSAPGAERRTLHLFAYGRRARVVVDGPTAIGTIGASDLIPAGRLLRLLRNGPVLGFAKDAEKIVLLLNVAWLLEQAA
ncbi:MAG: hypothetical protein JNJ46_29945 [Myxococcales bacterium]|nr:hypothetical protein [Myxococcales bacterium]